MKMCMPHWNALRSAIDERGLSGFVARSGEEAMENTVAELQGEAAAFDPLMSAHWAITNNALKCGGLYLLTQKEDGGEYCPLCEVGTHIGPETPAEWIKLASDAQLTYARELKLVPEVQ